MKVIQEIEDHIEKELHCSKKYIKCALNYKGANDPLANLYYQLSTNAMANVNKLHEMVVSIIEAYRKEHGEPPAEMLAVYNYLHNKEIDKAKDIKMMWEMYKS